MNHERLEQAINIMKRAGKVDMNCWQGAYQANIKQTEQEMHSCGNSACFAGWLAVSPEFRTAGGTINTLGVPVYQGKTGPDAILKWLDLEDEDIRGEVIRLLILGEESTLDSAIKWLEDLNIDPVSNLYYEKLKPGSRYSYAHFLSWHTCTTEDVIKILEALKTIGEDT